jgi:hypothetical protein
MPAGDRWAGLGYTVKQHNKTRTPGLYPGDGRQARGVQPDHLPPLPGALIIPAHELGRTLPFPVNSPLATTPWFCVKCRLETFQAT